MKRSRMTLEGVPGILEERCSEGNADAMLPTAA